jgi:hypothetical protein
VLDQSQLLFPLLSEVHTGPLWVIGSQYGKDLRIHIERPSALSTCATVRSFAAEIQAVPMGNVTSKGQGQSVAYMRSQCK